MKLTRKQIGLLETLEDEYIKKCDRLRELYIRKVISNDEYRQEVDELTELIKMINEMADSPIEEYEIVCTSI